ncbi:complement factor H-related protein 1-like [Varanus komodoensis]|uniref:complement factor H-related protein 1-like n=1 Tax=Varanus komodoensis TaxID=61221 RepID=UPI001CF79080|nr:complement factor H-related protein 1-like [Varanus komodoensis]
MLQFMCEEGRVLTAPAVQKCLDGHMDLPSCISERGKNCSHPPTIQNGDIVTWYQEQYTSGSSVEFKCQKYYAMEGHNKSFCDNGNWTKVPACLEITCNSPSVAAGTFRPQRNVYQYEDFILITCDSSSRVDKEQHFAECTRNGWSPAPECGNRTCREPPTVANGDIVKGAANSYPPGHQVHYQCYEGFAMKGSATVTCERKTWSEPPRCEDTTCPPPPGIANGQIKGQRKQKYLHMEWVHYLCFPGYLLTGNPTVRCLDKQWTEAPICRDAEGKCPLPPLIENGDIVNIPKTEYLPGESVQYQCQNFYKMEGSPTVTCNNGDWSAEPRCLVPCTASEEDMGRNNIKLRWKSDTKLYSESGDTIEFTCIHDFSLAQGSPPFRAQCRDGTITYPRCE